jgi:RNA polymerase primary sigma factor
MIHEETTRPDPRRLGRRRHHTPGTDATNTRTSRAFDPESLTSLDLYLREIGDYPLLTAAQERVLGRRAQSGDAAAAELLVTCNLRFVVMIAKKYQHLGLPLADLINEGNVGMIHAATKFDPENGARFVSYASWWVRQAVHRALDRAVTVRPKGANEEKLRRIRKHAARLAQLYAREPTLTELAGAAGVEVVEAAHALNLTAARRSGTGDDLLLERLPHPDQPLPDEETYLRERAERIEAVLGTLREREALVVRCYYGLGGCVAMTQAEIAEALGISPQRVQQLLVQGLTRLKEPARMCRLEPYR